MNNPKSEGHEVNIKTFGLSLTEAKKVIITVHGRGGDAGELVNSLIGHLQLDGFAILSPQATNDSWYPYSFLAPPAQNEPWLSSALWLLQTTVEKVANAGIAKDHLYFLGFSQGACLLLEYLARNAVRYGGAFAYSGGLIGDKLDPENYSGGGFDGTPIFLGCSDVDPHIPLPRVYASENILKDKGADVTTRIYPGMGHTINADELETTNRILSSVGSRILNS